MSRQLKKERGLYLRGKTWWITYTGLDGKQYRESAKTTKKTEAKDLVEERRTEIKKGKLPDIHRFKPITLSQLAKDYTVWAERQKDFKRKANRVKLLLRLFGDIHLIYITTKLLDQYQSKRLDQGYKSGTVNREMACLKHMIRKAVEWNMAPEHILKSVRKVKQLPEYNRRLRYLSEDEMVTLIDVCNPHLKPIVITALNTGMRKGEILNLKWDQIDLKNGFILLYVTKSGEWREIPINRNLREMLKGLTRHISSPYVFWHGEKGTPYKDVKRSFTSAVKKAGIKDFHFHDLRHTFASHLVMKGIDLTTVKELLGHKDITMTARYAHLAPAHKARAVSVMDDICAGPVERSKARHT